MANNMNLFGSGKPDEKQVEFYDKVDTHSKALLTLVQRQKDIESSMDLLNERIELLDHNSVSQLKKIFDDNKTLREEIKDLKHEIKEIKEFNMKVIKQLKLVATHDEVVKLEKYIDLWNPMEFVTRDELVEHRDKVKSEVERIFKKYLG